MFGGRKLGGNRPKCKESKEIESEYSWYYFIDEAADGKFLDWENVLDRETGDVMTFVNFRQAKNWAERKQYEFEENQNKNQKH